MAPAGFTLPVAPALDTISPPSASERLVAALQAVVHASPAGTTPAAQAVIDRELSRALATIQARLTRLSQRYPVAAGPDGGQYVRFVQALQATRPQGLTFQPLLTAGSVENLGLLRQNDVPLALVQSDVAFAALAGQGPFQSEGPFPALRALGSLYPEPLHIIVRADSPARSVRDVVHKRIGIGSPGSGTQATAVRVLSAYGLERGRDYEADEAPLIPALAALGSGAVDAVMQVIGTPADEIRTAAAAVKLRLLPIDQSSADGADRQGPRPAVGQHRQRFLSRYHPGCPRRDGRGAAGDDLGLERGGGGGARQGDLRQSGRSADGGQRPGRPARRGDGA